MRFEMINKDKIVFVIEKDDMRELGIDFNQIMYNTPKAREAFDRMVCMAKEATDFDFCDASLTVEAKPTEDNGLVMVISRNIVDACEVEKPKKGFQKGRCLRAVKELVYSFGSFEDIISMSENENAQIVHSSRLYSLEDRFYIVMKGYGNCSSSRQALFREYGIREKNSAEKSNYLSEYGNLIMSGDIIGQLRAHFC